MTSIDTAAAPVTYLDAIARRTVVTRAGRIAQLVYVAKQGRTARIKLPSDAYLNVKVDDLRPVVEPALSSGADHGEV